MHFFIKLIFPCFSQNQPESASFSQQWIQSSKRPLSSAFWCFWLDAIIGAWGPQPLEWFASKVFRPSMPESRSYELLRPMSPTILFAGKDGRCWFGGWAPSSRNVRSNSEKDFVGSIVVGGGAAEELKLEFKTGSHYKGRIWSQITLKQLLNNITKWPIKYQITKWSIRGVKIENLNEVVRQTK